MLLLETFFSWVIRSSAMASVILCIIILLKLIFKRRVSAQWHYYIWFLLIFRLIMPYSPESTISIFNIVSPLAEKTFILQNDRNAVSSYEKNGEEGKAGIPDNSYLVQTQQTDNDPAQSVVQLFSKLHSSQLLRSVLIPLWLIGAILFAVYILALNLKLSLKIRKQPQIQNQAMNEIFADCKSIMGVCRDIPVICSPAVRTPALFGFINPKLLLPANILDQMSSEDMKYVFLHELAHYVRKDILVTWLMSILKALHWFNPLIWWGFYRMHHDCEVACDSLVLSSIKAEERVAYGYTIIHMLKIISKPQRIPGSTGMVAGRSNVKRRITMITLFKKEAITWTVIAMVLFISLGFIGLTNAAYKRDIDSLQQSINNVRLAGQTANDDDSRYKALQKLLADNQIISGLAGVEGSGVIITMADADSSSDNKDGVTNPANALIHDSDIRGVINELNNAGAEAISINEERLIATSQIIASGAVIVINNKRFGSPFVIKAIGDPEALESALKIKGGLVERLSAFGLKNSIEKSEKLLIPKYEGEIDFKYAQPVNNQ